jgi:hypothetical protein
MSTTVGDNVPEVSCFPPWLPGLGTDWCKSQGGTPPPPWGENDNRGDQSATPSIPPAALFVLYGGLALFIFWLSVRALEAYASLKRD